MKKTLSMCRWKARSLRPDIEVVPMKDVKNFIKKCEEIITRRCMGTSANCYEIKKEIREEAGKELVDDDSPHGKPIAYPKTSGTDDKTCANCGHEESEHNLRGCGCFHHYERKGGFISYCKCRQFKSSDKKEEEG